VATSSSSSSPASSHARRSHTESIRRISFDNVEFINPLHSNRRWRLSYRGKGTFVQVYEGKSCHGSDPARVAIKLALNPSVQSIDQQLIHEAEMMETVARVSPNAVCPLLFQPKPQDDVIQTRSGGRQPVFIAMELVDCDFGELERGGCLSRCAMCEGFLLSFLALQDVHRGGVLHRDLKLNNLAFCLDSNVQYTAAASDTCSRDARLSARILDFGEAVPLRNGHPTGYGQCRSEYASIARHHEEEQGFKDDIEMLLYAFLDKMVAGGLPWKQEGQRLSRSEMEWMKVRFRGFNKGKPSEMSLVSMLSALDNTQARAAPPYQALKAALRRAWEAEWREHQSRGASLPKRLYDCIKLHTHSERR
jgi:serine/threonine protein kinase